MDSMPFPIQIAYPRNIKQKIVFFSSLSWCTHCFVVCHAMLVRYTKLALVWIYKMYKHYNYSNDVKNQDTFVYMQIPQICIDYRFAFFLLQWKAYQQCIFIQRHFYFNSVFTILFLFYFLLKNKIGSTNSISIRWFLGVW